MVFMSAGEYFGGDLTGYVSHTAIKSNGSFDTKTVRMPKRKFRPGTTATFARARNPLVRGDLKLQRGF